MHVCALYKIYFASTPNSKFGRLFLIYVYIYIHSCTKCTSKSDNNAIYARPSDARDVKRANDDEMNPSGATIILLYINRCTQCTWIYYVLMIIMTRVTRTSRIRVRKSIRNILYSVFFFFFLLYRPLFPQYIIFEDEIFERKKKRCGDHNKMHKWPKVVDTTHTLYFVYFFFFFIITFTRYGYVLANNIYIYILLQYT